MPKVFKLTPKRQKNVNGQVLSPSMVAVITSNLSSPFNNGAKEVKETYMRLYGVDFNRMSVTSSDFHIEIDK